MQIPILPPVRTEPVSLVPEPGAPRLNAGDVLRGEVVRAQDGQAVLRLDDGSILRAQMQEGLSLTAGETLSLTVAQGEGGKILLRLDGQVQERVEIAAAPSAPDGPGAELAALMRRYGMSPGQETLARVQKLIQTFPEINAQTAVFLAANGQSVGEGGPDAALRALAQALTELQPGAAAATSPMDTLLSAPDGQDAAPAQTDGTLVQPQNIPDDADALPAAQRALTRYLSAAAPATARALVASGQMGAAAAALSVSSHLAPEEAQAFLAAFVRDAALPQDALPALMRARQSAADMQASPGLTPGQAMDALLARLTPAQSTPTAQALPTQEAAAPAPPLPAAGTPAPPAPAGSSAPAQAVPLPGSAAMQPPPAAPMPPLSPAAPTVSAAPAGDVPAPLAGTSVQTALPPAADAMLTTPPPPRAEPFAHDASLPRTPGEELARAVVGLTRNLGALHQALAAAPGHENAAASAALAQARAQGLNTLTQLTCIQIPVEMYERRQSADLYILRRPRRDAPERDEYIIAVALETQNMGRVEAVIKARERQLDITFRMDGGEAASSVRAQFPALEQSVREAGFSLKSAVLTRLHQPITPQNAEKELGGEQADSIFILDVRV